MALPTFASGQRLRASALQAIIDSFRPLKARRGSDLTRTNTITVTADPVLALAVAANTTYRVEIELIYVESAAQGVDLKVGFTFPALAVFDATASGAHQNWNGTASTNLEAEWSAWQNESSPSTTKIYGTTTGTNFGVKISGTLVVGANAGTFTVLWAQGTLSATNSVTLKLGSSVVLTPLP